MLIDPKIPGSRFVGLDLSVRSTGVVVLSGDGEILDSLAFGQALTRRATERERVERLIYIAERICEIVDAQRDNGASEVYVGIERYAYGARGAQNDLAELHGAVKSLLWLKCGTTPTMVQISAARKEVLGHGLPKNKAQIVELIRQHTGHKFYCHDEADAYVVAEYLRRKVASAIDCTFSAHHAPTPTAS